jgi:hypothetical protein
MGAAQKRQKKQHSQPGNQVIVAPHLMVILVIEKINKRLNLKVF